MKDSDLSAFMPDTARTALVIVDMQKDFCEHGFGAENAGRNISHTRSIIESIRTLLSAAREHGVYVAHVGFWTLPDHASDSRVWLQKRRQATYSATTLCIADTDGARFIDDLAPRPGEGQIHKQRYSGFKGTNLALLLSAHDVQSVVVTGVSTNVCVESTLRDAFEHDLHVVVPQDAVASWSRPLHDATLENVRHRFGCVSNTSEIIGCWKTARGHSSTTKVK